jgi:hypothetical protein
MHPNKEIPHPLSQSFSESFLLHGELWKMVPFAPKHSFRLAASRFAAKAKLSLLHSFIPFTGR